MQDQNHPFLRLLWRRIALVTFCTAWSIFEFVSGWPFWGVLAGGMTVVGVYQFLIAYKPDADSEAGKE